MTGNSLQGEGARGGVAMAPCSGAVMIAAVVSRIAIGDMSLERYDSRFREAGNIAQMELNIGTDLAPNEMVRARKILEGHEAVEEIFMGYRLYESRMTCSFVKIGMERGKYCRLFRPLFLLYNSIVSLAYKLFL